MSSKPAAIGTIALGLEYDGSGLSGWQYQGNRRHRTVQELVEQGLSEVAAEPLRLSAAGRTDAGVHACGQVAQFRSAAVRSEDNWVRGGNRGLPSQIRILWARRMPADFHVQHSAISRHYRYLIHNTEWPSALWHRRLWQVQPSLDVALMHQAAQCLVGEHDFSAFRAASCQSRSAQRQLQRISVSRRGRLVIVDVEANAFLHHMVRNIVGSLIEVGGGVRPPGWIAALLADRDRSKAAPTAAPDGLYLLGVHYPDRFDLPRFPVNDPLFLLS